MEKIIPFLLIVSICTGCGMTAHLEELDKQKQKKDYILSDPVRPTHWDQSQWDTLDKYLKRIDELDKRVTELEK